MPLNEYHPTWNEREYTQRVQGLEANSCVSLSSKQSTAGTNFKSEFFYWLAQVADIFNASVFLYMA